MTAATAPSRTLTTGKVASPERWRLAAQRARAEGITVRQVNDTGQWIATSGSSKTRAYTLEIVNGMVISCSCEAAQFSDPVCKHRAAWALNQGFIVLDESVGDEDSNDAVERQHDLFSLSGVSL